MPVRKIVTYGHPVLEKVAEPVSEIDGRNGFFHGR